MGVRFTHWFSYSQLILFVTACIWLPRYSCTVGALRTLSRRYSTFNYTETETFSSVVVESPKQKSTCESPIRPWETRDTKNVYILNEHIVYAMRSLTSCSLLTSRQAAHATSTMFVIYFVTLIESQINWIYWTLLNFLRFYSFMHRQQRE